MVTIELSGRHAIGEYRFALVDEEDVAYLSQWRWKAKPNGSENNIYAVRNAVIDGRHVTIRMHREVLGLSASDPRDVDHLNHCGVDNRRGNLRVVSRSESIKNSRRRVQHCLCAHCGCAFDVNAMLHTRPRLYCSEACDAAARRAQRSPYSSVAFVVCQHCQKPFVAERRSRMFCSDACRCASKYRRLVGMRRGDSQDARVRAALPARFTSKDVAGLSGVHESDVRRILRGLVVAGEIELIKSGRPKLYAKV